MIAEAGGNLIIKMVLSEQRVTLDFPIGYKLEENSKIIKLQDVISKKGGNANN